MGTGWLLIGYLLGFINSGCNWDCKADTVFQRFTCVSCCIYSGALPPSTPPQISSRKTGLLWPVLQSAVCWRLASWEMWMWSVPQHACEKHLVFCEHTTLDSPYMGNCRAMCCIYTFVCTTPPAPPAIQRPIASCGVTVLLLFQLYLGPEGLFIWKFCHVHYWSWPVLHVQLGEEWFSSASCYSNRWRLLFPRSFAKSAWCIGVRKHRLVLM